MIPIDDANPTQRAPLVTLALIAACLGAFAWWFKLEPWDQSWSIHSLGVIPAVIFGTMSLDPYIPDMPRGVQFATAPFLHGGWIHLVGNMLYLWIFGNNVEDKLGHRRFLIFFLLSAAAGMGAYVALSPASTTPLIGTSAAISGVLSAYFLLFPYARVRMVIPPLFFRTFTLPVWTFLGFWVLLQSVNLAADLALGSQAAPQPDKGGLAWSPLVAGFLAGVVLLLVLRPSGVRLFQRPPGQRQGAPRPARQRKRDDGSITRAGAKGATQPVRAAGPWTMAQRTHAVAIPEVASKQVQTARQTAITALVRQSATVVAEGARRGAVVRR
jgi:membrane associated rhomboid family serine protease